LDLIILPEYHHYHRLVFYEPNKFSVHAEREAIMNVKDKAILKECKIVIIRISNGKVTETTPCTMCSKLLNKYKLTNVNTLIDDKIIKI
jgi:cytidine deaminase